MIRRCTSIHDPGWLSLRNELWPNPVLQDHLAEMQSQLDEPGRFVHFLALDKELRTVGFAEASLRHDYVNGTSSTPVAFLEGIFVSPEHRGQGIARKLIDAVTDWAAQHDCCELASDSLLENEPAHQMHKALGFEETERVVYFRKSIESRPPG